MATVNYLNLAKASSTALGAVAVQSKASSRATSFVGTILNSLGLTIATELGDKTFFIAAILATQQNIWLVYLGCFSALAFMTIVSSTIGGIGATILGTLIPRKYTQLFAILLLIYFGASMISDSLFALINDSEDEELELLDEQQMEAEEELKTRFKTQAEIPVEENDETHEIHRTFDRTWKYIRKQAELKYDALLETIGTEEFALVTQIFSINVLAEFGDKSQLATMAMASSSNFVAVALGGFVGHAICTGLAVSGGFIISEQISGAQIKFVGGALFLAFALHSYLNLEK